jgi:glutamine amidotransferase
MNRSQTIVIVDYEMGNIRSIVNKVHRAGYEPIVTNDENIIYTAEKLILPGVGNFLNGMAKLKGKNLINLLNKKVLEDRIPILGICLGMQLFTNFSEEGNVEGLGWIDAETVLFHLEDIRHKVPHMGWNSLSVKKESPLINDLPDDSQFYFVHSYHIRCNCKDDILSTTEYGYEFVSAIQKSNIFGTQFHPEKSHGAGELILSNFLKM